VVGQHSLANRYLYIAVLDISLLAGAQIEKADSMKIRKKKERKEFLFIPATSTFLYSFVTFRASLKQ
jgi:hypothetical protein